MSPTYNNLNSSFEIDKQQENSYIYYNQANQVLQSEQLRREIYPIRTIPYLPKQAILKSPPKYKIKQADIQTKEDSFFDNIQMGMDTLQEQSSQKEDTSQEEDSQIFITNNQNSYSNVSSVKSSFDQNKNQMGSTKKEQKIHKEVSLNTYQQSLKKQTSILISNKSILDSEIQIKQQSDISSSEIDSKHLLYLPKQEKEVVQKKNQLQQIQPTQNETSSEKIEYISSHFSQYSPKNQKFQNKVDTQGFSSFYDKQVNQRYSIEKTSDSVIQSQNQIANQNQRKQKTLKQFFQGVLKMIGPIIAFRKQSIKRERARTMPKKKTIFNKDNQRHSNLGILTSEFIKSNSLVNSNDELELFDNIKQDKTLINIDLNKKNPNQKRYSNMYTYQSLLEIKIQNMNLNKQLLFNKIETFDEEAANKLVQDGLNIKNIELEANIVENDLTPEAWIKKIQNMNLPYQARCLFYKDKKYVWEKVNILEYSEEKMKYLVEFIEGGQKKFVNRNVIAFRFEKMENIISRIETIISKSKLVQDEKKFQIFVSKVDDSLVENMQSEQKQRIFNLCLRQDYLKNVKKKILSEAILHQMSQEVDKLYKHKMKEILVIYQMQKPEFQEYFYKEADLEPRLLYAPSFPFMTSIYRSENFAQITKYFLLKRNVFLKNECQKSLSQVQNINIQFGMKPAFDIQIETIKPPKNIDQLIKIQKESIDNMRIRLITNYRENMIHEIFDKLQKFYKFFETDIDKYRNSLLFRFLKRVEFQIVESLGENVFKHNCFIWLKFLQSFTYPEIKLLSQENNKIKNSTLTQEEIDFQVKQIKLSEVWVCNNKQLLNLRVVCTDQGKIAFQPAFEEIFQQLCQPIHMLNEMVNSFQKLEKTVVPLLDFDLPETYKIDHGPYVNTVKDFIFSFIQAQWDTYLTPIVEKYSQFSHFFLEESTQVFQIFKEGSEMNQNFSISVFLLDAQLYSQSNKQKVSQNQPQQNQSNKSWITSQVQNVQNQQNANYISNNFGAQSNNLNVTNNFVQKSNQKIFEKGLANILLDMTIVRESGNIYSLNQLKDTNRIREILRKLHEDIQKAKMLECDIVKTPLFFINVQPCKKNTVFFGMNAKTTILKSIAFIIQQNIGTLQESFEHFKLKISKYPTNEEELVQSKIIISGCESDIENFQTEIKNIGQYIDLIEEFYFQMNPTTWEAYWMLYTCPQLVREKLQQSKQVIAQQEKKFIDSLDKERQLLQLKIENIFQDFQTVKNFNNYQLAKDYCMEAQSLNEQINDAIYQGQQINKREQLLQLQLTKYVLLEQIKQQSIYFIKLWELAFQLQIDRHKWMLGSLMKISFEQFKQKILEYDHNKEEIKVKIQELVEDKSIIKVIQEIQKDIDQSREISWMIEYLTTEAMIKKPQFFKDLFRECNLPMIEPNEDMSLKALIDVDLIHFRDQIRECSERADNVFNTEKQLQQIQDRLKETLLELIEYRETFIISNLSNLQKIIVEQNNSIQEIKNSEREKLAPKYTQEIDQKVQSVSFNIGKIQEFQQLYVQAGNIIDTIEYEKKTNSLMKPFHQSESFWRGVIRFVRENNSLFETDFNFDYDNQIQSLQKFILQFKDDKKQTDN